MIDFQGFSPESFQQLIGLLSLQVFGQGATIYGPGPDGGRDITFRGRVDYPFGEAQSWDGYGVVQVKFKSKRESSQVDQLWAERQLKQELMLWLSEPRRTPKPEYFVFATNVEFTAAAAGGRDRVEALLRNHAAALGLKGHSIWDANQLRMLIDSHPLVRERFSAFFTPGDVLAALAKRGMQTVDADAILTNFLRGGLLADENARLGQAGHRSDERMRLSQLFVDLPYSDARPARPTAFPVIRSLTAPLCLRLLCNVAHQKLDPRTLYEQNVLYEQNLVRELQPRTTNESPRDRACGRFLLIGGPGSGKSTIGQFLAQMHRAALLDRRPAYRLDAPVRTIIGAMKVRCADDLVDWPDTPRFPIRVELSAFAKALDSSEPAIAVRTFSEYLRAQLSRNTPLTHETLREWMRAYPWLLVLDGLDEVPAASNRGPVITALREFLGEMRDLEADLLVLASTRPEGYEGEFDDADMRTLTLCPLSPATARDCAERYIAAKIGTHDENRAREARATIVEAIHNPLTSRLMTSPLQVTFMTAVVAVSGKPSESRWQLFSDYFRIVYDRELHKAVPPFNRVLSKRRQVIEALHQKVGFILQYRAEHSGETQADLAFEEFVALVDGMLREDGLDGDELVRERDEIVGAARLRLVFLTSRTVARLSFEVRSLQEYMAAALLTNGDIAPVVQRLETTAHSAYWRNTLLFAIGRFFDDVNFRNQRGQIRLLCEDLNRKEELRASVRLGSRLALDILDDGAATAVPLVSRSLAAYALQLLELRSYEWDDAPRRLSSVYQTCMEPEFKRVITTLLGLKQRDDATGAWLVLLFLEQRQVRWASELLGAHWPSDAEHARSIVAAWLRADRHTIWEGRLTEAMSPRIKQLFGQLSVLECWHLVSPALSMWSLRRQVHDIELRDLIQMFQDQTIHSGQGLTIAGVRSIALHVNLVRSRITPSQTVCDLIDANKLQADWPDHAPLFEFMRDPNAATLSAALRCVATLDEPISFEPWLSIAPWPLTLYLATRPSREVLAAKAQTVEQDIGDVDQWLATERQWRGSGLTREQLLAPASPGLAAPCEAFRYSFRSSELGPEDLRTIEILCERLQCSPNMPAGKFLWHMLNGVSDPEGLLTPEWILRQARMSRAPQIWLANDFGNDPLALERQQDAWLELYDWMGRQPELSADERPGAGQQGPFLTLLQGFENDPSKLGLLRLAAFWSVRGHRPQPSTLQFLQSLRLEQDYEWARNLLLMLDPEVTTTQVTNIGRRLATIIPDTTAPIRLMEATLYSVKRHAKNIPQLHAALAPLEQLTALPGCDQFAADIEHLRYTSLRSQPSGLDEVRLRALELMAH